MVIFIFRLIKSLIRSFHPIDDDCQRNCLHRRGDTKITFPMTPGRPGKSEGLVKGCENELYKTIKLEKILYHIKFNFNAEFPFSFLLPGQAVPCPPTISQPSSQNLIPNVTIYSVVNFSHFRFHFFSFRLLLLFFLASSLFSVPV